MAPDDDEKTRRAVPHCGILRRRGRADRLFQLLLLAFRLAELPEEEVRRIHGHCLYCPGDLLFHRSEHGQIPVFGADDQQRPGLYQTQRRVLVRHRQPGPRLLVSGLVCGPDLHQAGPGGSYRRVYRRRDHRVPVGLRAQFGRHPDGAVQPGQQRADGHLYDPDRPGGGPELPHYGYVHDCHWLAGHGPQCAQSGAHVPGPGV